MPKEWRKRAREFARERAKAEAKERWGVSRKRDIPFDYRWEHVKAVASLAKGLGQQLSADLDVVEAAAWLHDICKTEPSHGIAGAKEAADFLTRSDFPKPKIEAVSYAIARHVGLYRPRGAAPLEPLETAILWDADKLSKLGVQAVVFSMMSPYGLGKSMSQRRRDYVRFVDEILYRTVESMNTDLAQEMARQRFAEMQTMLQTWKREEYEQE
jgi:uncharacterized protein